MSSGSFTAPDHECPSYLELRLTATDSGGLTSTVSRRLDPRTVVLSSQTDPGGMQLAFTSWSDDGTQTHDVIAPPTATTYTAKFRQR